MTLTEFLVARIAEDEAVARAVAAQGEFPSYPYGLHADELDYCGRFSPAHVLAECEAKRRIVEFYGGPVGQMYVLQFLALPYADHPDYREEWRP